MIGEGGRARVSLLPMAAAVRLRRRIAIVQPKSGCAVWLYLGQPNPGESFVEQSVEALELIAKKCLVVFRHEANVAAVLLCERELEIAIMQSDQDDRPADRGCDVRGSGIDCDLLSGRPILIPPRTGVGRLHKSHTGDEK